MSASRKKAIYEICVTYDVIIVEDDRASTSICSRLWIVKLTVPFLAAYYFLQAGEYSPPNSFERTEPKKKETDDEFLASLVPSYLKFDYQGRVIRIDTFSSTSLAFLFFIPFTQFLSRRRNYLSWITSRIHHHEPRLCGTNAPRQRVDHSSALWIRTSVSGEAIGRGVGT